MKKKPWSLYYDGQSQRPPNPHALQLGAFTFDYVHGQIRYVCWNDIEIARRVYGAIRDDRWGTVPSVVENESIIASEHEIRITFNVSNQSGLIDFEWAGEIAVTEMDTLTFSFSGVSRSHFLRNRIGLCLLHPIESTVGKVCRVRNANGGIRTFQFKEAIHPENPATEIACMTYPLDTGHELAITFHGDLFEMEDQRNWIDDSFKTFCTPLNRAHPVAVDKGDSVYQRIELKVLPVAPSKSTYCRQSAITKPEPIEISVGPTILNRSHRVGLCWERRDDSLTELQINRFRKMCLQHLRVDIDLRDSSFMSTFVCAQAAASAVGSDLELAIRADENHFQEIRELANGIQESIVPVCRSLLYSVSMCTTPDPFCSSALGILREAIPSMPVYAGTLANFAELNRHRPSASGLTGLCFSAQPQEHAFDNASLIETPRSLGQTVFSVSKFAPDLGVCVGPITLRKRLDPYGAPIAEEFSDRLPARVDARQMSLLGAGWTLACLKHLAETGADSSTWFQMMGWKGVIESDQPNPLPHLFASLPGMVFPIYHILSDWCQESSSHVVTSVSSDRLAVESIVRKTELGLHISVVNLGSQSQQLRFTNLTGNGTIRMLDEHSFELATQDADRFRDRDTHAVFEADEIISLAPFATALIMLPSK